MLVTKQQVPHGPRGHVGGLLPQPQGRSTDGFPSVCGRAGCLRPAPDDPSTLSAPPTRPRSPSPRPGPQPAAASTAGPLSSAIPPKGSCLLQGSATGSPLHRDTRCLTASPPLRGPSVRALVIWGGNTSFQRSFRTEADAPGWHRFAF